MKIQRTQSHQAGQQAGELSQDSKDGYIGELETILCPVSTGGVCLEATNIRSFCKMRWDICFCWGAGKPAQKHWDFCMCAEYVVSTLLTSPAAARLAVEVLQMQSDNEQFVSWAGPLAVQALTSSLPVPASELWLQAPLLILDLDILIF